jgi:hypothetical protein
MSMRHRTGCRRIVHLRVNRRVYRSERDARGFARAFSENSNRPAPGWLLQASAREGHRFHRSVLITRSDFAHLDARVSTSLSETVLFQLANVKSDECSNIERHNRCITSTLTVGPRAPMNWSFKNTSGKLHGGANVWSASLYIDVIY